MQRTPRRLLTFCLAAIITSGCAEEAPVREPIDLLLHSGQILVLDEADTRAQAMAVKDGRIVAIGANALADRFAPTQSVDLEGKTVIPGFNDTHVHISGSANFYIDLTKVSSIREMQALVRAKAETLPDGHWITGYGWSEDELEEGRKPVRTDLDAAAPDNPVMLTRAGAHSAVFSTTALALAGVDASTPNPPGGEIERDDNGELNGIVREAHDALTAHLIPNPSFAALNPSLKQTLTDLFALGITSLTHAQSSIEEFRAWEALYETDGAALPRAKVQIEWAGAEAMDAFGRRSGDGDNRFMVGPTKIFVDGGFTGPAAYTKAPYRGEDSYRGALTMTEAELATIIQDAHERGWQMGIHAIGDAAIELTVDLLVDALEARPRADHRHYLNHFTVTPSPATMDAMASNGIAITQQPNFAYTLEGRYVDYLGGERLAHNNPVATPMKHGIHVAISSDILPLGPWVGIYAAVTRRGMSGKVHGESERISRIEALRGYTARAAYLTFEEAQKGQLLPGMLADFVVLADNPLLVPEDELMNVRTASTWLGGTRVYEAEAL